MPSQDNYRIHLETFEGPLDLLLFLIRRAEVDVTDIPIAVITDDYLAILRQSTAVDVDAAAEFLVMAATLVELKSRTLMPVEAREAADRESADGDPRQALIQQLLDYQRVRLAAEELAGCKVEAQRRLEVRIATGSQESIDESVELDLDDVHSMDLAEAYERLSSIIDFDRLGEHIVAIDDTPILLHQADLVDRLQRRDGAAVDLLELFDGCTPGQRIGLFLATLELVRRGQVRVDQDGEGPIVLELREGGEHFEYDEDGSVATAEDAPTCADGEAHCDPDHATALDEAPSASVDQSTGA